MRYFRKYAWRVFQNGFDITPIKVDSKAPVFKGWSSLEPNENDIEDWIDEYPACGVGILTTHTPAIDIDCHDQDIIDHMVKFCEKLLGVTIPKRLGFEPKLLLLCRTNRPFRKVQSATYIDGDDNRNKLEILGEGQQFVAFHTHPETGRPYKWLTESDPSTIDVDDLPVLSEKNARIIVAEFDSVIAGATDWTLASAGKNNNRPNKRTGVGSRNDFFIEDKEPINIDVVNLREHLMTITDVDDYHIWFQVGMALHHQFSGEVEGLELWVEWSETGDKYVKGACEEKWKSFDISNKGREPTTARYILHLATEAAETEAAELYVELTDGFSQCRSEKEWRKLAERTSKVDIDQLQRDSLVTHAHRAYCMITGSRASIGSVRKALSYKIDNRETPAWCSNFVYVTDDDKFFNMIDKTMLTKQGFDASFSRYTKGDDKNKNTVASELALNVYKIKVVTSAMYSPKRDLLFTYANKDMVNSYPDNQVPEIPQRWTPKDKANVTIVKNHVKFLLEDEREIELFLSWLAYVVQNVGEIVKWAVVLQGVEGDGKSFFAALLQTVMGIDNVKMLNAPSLKSDFTDWAMGQCVCAIEEIRLQGENKYEILNKVKPMITNEIIEVHPKGKKQMSIENTTNYILFTNYRDALPLDDNSRRYFVLFSKWQSASALKGFTDKNPRYFDKLYNTLKESAGALRDWLLDYDICDEFKQSKRAPMTEAFKLMVLESQPDEIQDLMQIVVTGEDPLVSDELLSLTRYNQTTNSGQSVHGNRLKKLLQHAGFFKLNGRLTINRTEHYFYSKEPMRFTIDGTPSGLICRKKILEYIEKHNATLNSDDNVWD